MDRSAIILAGGSSIGFGEDKGLLKLNNKPLLKHVVDTAEGIVDEVIIVTSSEERANLYSKSVSSNVQFAIDNYDTKGQLVGAIAGFEAAQGKYSLLLPFDTPFASPDVLTLLFELSNGKSAVIPRSPDCEIEPLQAVYNTKQALEAAKMAFANNELDLAAMICKLRGVRYISTMVIEQLDPDLRTFFTINRPLDIKKATVMLKPRKQKAKQ